MVATMERPMPSPRIGPEFVSLKDFAATFGVSEKHAYNLAVGGKIASVRLGRVIRVPATEVDRLKGEARRNGD